MAGNDEIITDVGGAFDEIRTEFFPGAVLELLKISASTNDFIVVETIDAGWYLKYAKYRNQFELQIARTDPEFKAVMAQIESVRVSGDVYASAQADRIAPAGANLFWTLYCTRQQGARPTRGAR